MFDLKQWAATNKVSNSQLHRMTGISESTIASVMRGCSCTERTLKRICRGIGRPYDPAEWKNPVPKSVSKVKREKMLSGSIKPGVKPDLDNVAKSILDALNGIAYYDDNQITDLKIAKRYSEKPRVDVILKYEKGA